MSELINGRMKVAEVIRRWPKTFQILRAYGCPDMRCGLMGIAAKFMSVQNAARVHGLNPEALLKELNEVIRQSQTSEGDLRVDS
ncbi:MAG: DUF1858 domain-containing protein [Planctomycetes bacterium]|nr:DUF1858 domain-containing protein [Planctomycetota bacterium]